MSAAGLLIDLTPLRVSQPFRRIFVARLISLIGIGLLLVTVPVQMYELTGSSLQVGAATAVTGVTTFLGMLIGGSLADRFDRRLLIVTGRSGAAASFALLAVNAFGGFGEEAAVPVLYLLAGVDGLIGSLSAAALMAAVPTLIPREHLVAVGALSALTVRLGTAISPGIAGFIIAAAGFGWTYTIAAMLATVTVLILLGLPSLPHDAPHAGDPETPVPLSADGDAEPATAPAVPTSVLRFIAGQPVVAGVMLVGVIAMLGAGVVALLPALVAERFDGDARATGLLYAAIAAGAVVAALTSGWLARLARPGLTLLGALILGFALFIVFGLAEIVWIALLLLLIIGVIEAVQEVLRYSLIQHHTPGPLLGRVNGIWMAQEVGGVTVGALVAGLFGTLWSAGDAIVYYGIALLVLALLAAVALGGLRRVPGQTAEAATVGTQ